MPADAPLSETEHWWGSWLAAAGHMSVMIYLRSIGTGRWRAPASDDDKWTGDCHGS